MTLSSKDCFDHIRNMSFLHVKLRMAVVFFILISVVFFDVMANKNNSINPGSRNINCTCAWRSVANSRSNLCLKNESTVTIWLNNSVGGKYLNYLCFNLFLLRLSNMLLHRYALLSEHEEIRLIFNQTDCEASLLSETKMQDITVPCNVTRRKQRHHMYRTRKEEGVRLSVDIIDQERLQVTIRGNDEGQDESSRYKIGFNISFKVSFFLQSQANYYSFSQKPINDHHYVRWMNPDT